MTQIKNQSLKFDDIEPDNTYFNCTFAVSNAPIRVGDVTFDHCKFLQDNFDRSDWNFVIFKGCSFLNASFHESYLSNSQFIGGQLMGADFSVGTRIVNCQFVDSNLRYANLSETKMTVVKFTNSNLTESSFQAVTFKKQISFDQSELDQIDFLDTNLKGVDLSKAKFETLLVNPELIKGLKINSWQASLLIGLLGVEVVD